MNATVRMEVAYHNKDEYLLESKTRFINKIKMSLIPFPPPILKGTSALNQKYIITMAA
jgi:hypothetical protein